MSTENLRIAIAGAVTLLGKEVNEEISQSSLVASTVKLLDEGEAAGKLEAVADEVTFIQSLEPGAFDRNDIVFFTGAQATTQKHWKEARAAGASIVDVTYALESEGGVLVRSPLVHALQDVAAQGPSEQGPDLYTAAVVSAHPVAVMLGVTASALRRSLAVRSLAATVLQPASEGGTAGTDELHQQTVNLLSFHSLPQENFDAQVAFNLLPALGSEARASLAVTSDRVRKHYGAIAGKGAPEITLQLLQAPVFHGYAVSVLVELENPASVMDVERALVNDAVEIVSNEGDPPSNLTAAGQGKILLQVTSASGETKAKRFWIWMVADNLKLSALNAIACAEELRRLRPSGKVQ